MTDSTPSIIKRGYIVLSADGVQTRRAPVSSADEASSVWRGFVEKNGLGASDLKRDSGFIYSNDRKLVAKVSYNGRVWTPDGQLLQEMPMPTYEPGDYVKVEFPDEVTKVAEWMWVKVEVCDDSKKIVFGTLDNEPLNDLNGKIGLGSRLAISYGQIREHRKPTEFTKQ